MALEVPIAISALGYKTLWEFMIEFGIISSLFGMAFKQSLSVVNGLQESMRKKEFGDMASNVFGSSQYKQSSNAFGLLLGIGCAYILMFKYKVTLGTVADNGIAAAFFSFCIGAFAYAWISARVGPNKKLWSVGGAGLVALVFFAFFTSRTTLGPQLFYSIIPFFSFGLFILAMLTVGEKSANAASGASPPPGLPGITPSPPSGTAPVPPGPAGMPVAAQNAEDAVSKHLAALDQKVASITDLVPKLDALNAALARNEKMAETTGIIISSAEKAVETGDPNAPAKIAVAVDNLHQLVDDAENTFKTADKLVDDVGKVVDDKTISDTQEGAKVAIKQADGTIERVGAEAASDPANADLVEKLEHAEHGVKGAGAMLSGGADVARQQSDIINHTIETDVEQIERWRAEAKSLIDEIRAITAQIEEKNKSKTFSREEMRSLLARSAMLRDRWLQTSEAHKNDADTMKLLFAGLRRLFQQRQAVVKGVVKTLDNTGRELIVVKNELVPRLVMKERAVESEEKPLIDLVGLVRELREMSVLLMAIESIRFEGGKRGPVYAVIGKSDIGKLRDSVDKALKVLRGFDDLRAKIAEIPTKTPALSKLERELSTFPQFGLSIDLDPFSKILSSAAGMGGERAGPLLVEPIKKFKEKKYSLDIVNIIGDIAKISKEMSAEIAQMEGQGELRKAA